MKVKISFIRHGQTDANKDRIYQGQTEFMLNSTGRNMAKEVGDIYKNRLLGTSIIYSSDLSRAYETATLMLEQALLDYDENNAELPTKPIIQTTPLLREKCYGIKEGLPKITTIEEARIIQSKRLNIPPEEIQDHAETFDDVVKRQKLFLQALLTDCFANIQEDQNHERHIFVVTHGRFIKIFLKYFCSIEAIDVQNCSTTTVQLEISLRNSPVMNNDDSISTTLDSVTTTTTSHDEDRGEEKTNSSLIFEWSVGDLIYCVTKFIPIEINNTSPVRC